MKGGGAQWQNQPENEYNTEVKGSKEQSQEA